MNEKLIQNDIVAPAFEIGELEEVVQAPVGIAVKDWYTVIGVIVVVAVMM